MKPVKAYHYKCSFTHWPSASLLPLFLLWHLQFCLELAKRSLQERMAYLKQTWMNGDRLLKSGFLFSFHETKWNVNPICFFKTHHFSHSSSYLLIYLHCELWFVPVLIWQVLLLFCLFAACIRLIRGCQALVLIFLTFITSSISKIQRFFFNKQKHIFFTFRIYRPFDKCVSIYCWSRF